MVGISLALQLGAVLPERYDITLVESFPVPEPTASGAAQYHPSFDARSTALSYSSKCIYAAMGVWDSIAAHVCPISDIHVSTRARFGSTLLRAMEQGWDALGYVVENAWLGNALIQALHRQGRVQLLSPEKVLGAEPGEAQLRLRMEGDEQALACDLLIVADGASSALRASLGVGVQEKPYHQHALIANIASAQPHAGRAFERFTDEGPLALLPLIDGPGGEQRSALVWTLPPARAQALLDASDAQFLEALQARFGYRLGRLQQVGERSSYPLSLVEASEQVRRQVVIMGNAAHALHPVAGQGFNLALRDIAQLSRVLNAAVAANQPLGELAVLQRYVQRQRSDQARTIAFSDRVPALFMQTDPLLGLGRDLALAGMDVWPSLRRAFTRQAAGMSAGVARTAQSVSHG